MQTFPVVCVSHTKLLKKKKKVGWEALVLAWFVFMLQSSLICL